MHPSLQHKFRLRSAQDVALAELMITSAKRAGWTEFELDGFLTFYALQVQPHLESGQIDAEAAKIQLWDYAERQGISLEKRNAVLGWQEQTADYMAAHDGELPALPTISPEDAAAERSAIEAVMRDDPARYFADQQMQSRLYALLSSSQDQPANMPIATPANLTRVRAIEALMGDTGSEYWAGPNAAAIQSEYRTILSLGAPAGANAGAGELGAAAAGAGQ